MDSIVERVDVWAATIKDKCGGLAVKLAGLREAGADLDFIIARRAPEKPGTGALFVTPLRGDREIAAAANLGFNITSGIHSVRFEGDNKPGAAAQLTQKLAAAGLNLRGLSVAVIGPRFTMYIGLDNAEDAENALNILRKT